MKAYIVKTSDGYLCPRDGDVGWTASETDAGHFVDADEAKDTAELAGYDCGDFEVLSVDVAHRLEKIL